MITMKNQGLIRNQLVSKYNISSYVQTCLVICCLCCQLTLSLKYYYGDGSYYTGDVDERGRPSGKGQFHNISGELEYDGDFLEGHPHGFGTWYGQDGTVFKGQFRYGRSNGRAVRTKPNGDRIEGEFLNLRPHGTIVFTKASYGDGTDFRLRTIDDSNEKSIRVGGDNEQVAADFDRQIFQSDSRSHGSGRVTRVEGEFRNGMAHGNVKLWYHGSDENVIKIEGIFRMGQPHGYFTFMNEDDTILAETKYLNGEPLENVHGRSNAKSKPHLLKIPKKVVL